LPITYRSDGMSNGCFLTQFKSITFVAVTRRDRFDNVINQKAKMDLTEIEVYEKRFGTGTIIDGVIDGEKYANSNYKIAWFLKEPYSSEDDGFHMRKYYAQPDAYNNFFRNTATPTWHPVIYTSYGILNGFLKWDNLSYIRHQPDMCEVVKSIAIINANKRPSKTDTVTLYNNLNEGFNEFRELIEAQVEVLQPQIHIFCRTFYLYKDYFGLTEEHQITSGQEFENCSVWGKDGKLFLDVYHPANRTQKRDVYVNQIISAAEKWANREGI
jgi:hypothetical protein